MMLFREPLTRREFLKKLGLLGLGLGGLTVLSNCSSERPAPSADAEGLHEARWYENSPRQTVQCRLCFRGCIIAEGKRGFCRARENRGGKLYTLVYGKPCAIQIDPIELEPMYHLLPGHRNLALATASCNFRCKFCQNWHISQRSPEETRNRDLSPQEIVIMAIERGCKSISSTMNEPIVFYEYMYDINRLAKEMGLRTLFHTNGSLRPEPLFALLEYMDAVTVDLKAFTQQFYEEVSESELEPVLETLRNVKKAGVHLEIVNLVIPTLNDNLDDIRRMCVWIRENLGAEVPLHFTRFFPAYKLTSLPPTPVATLEAAVRIADEEGLRYVYIGNVPGHERNSTFCPECGERVIHRIHCNVLSMDVERGKCRFCEHEIPGIW
jgi:pyruvate formate lyase activating enzyme